MKEIVTQNPHREPVDPSAGDAQDTTTAGAFSRLLHALGPIVPGVIIDGLDLVTFGPIGLLVGMILGFLAGYWLSTEYRLSTNMRLVGALAAGFYCMLPFTSFIPVATLMAVFFRFNEHPETG